MTVWVDVVARARGLRTHRLPPATLASLRRSPDLPALGRALRAAGFPVEEGEGQPSGLERAIRRRAAAELQILARWCGPRAAALSVIFEDEDRRSLRALLRGALQGASTDVRLAGLVPTPTLPERALTELAGARGPGAAVALLTVWNHPFAAELRGAATSTAPDPLALEIALTQVWAHRAVAGARLGGAEVTAFVEDAIDLTNAVTAVALAGAPDSRPSEQFLSRGQRVTAPVYTAAAAAPRPAVFRILSGAFSGSAYALVFRPENAGVLEDAILEARVRAQQTAARHSPLGPAMVLWYALELRAETISLSRMVWARTLGAPAETVLTAFGGRV